MDVRLPDGTVIRGIPEGTTKAQLMEKLAANGYDVSQLEAPQQEQQQAYQYGPVREDIDPDALSTDKDWLEASRVVYRMNEGKEWTGADTDLAEYGLETMGWFNYNLPAMAIDANKMQSATQSEKEAFLHLMDSYDNMNVSWGGVGRFFKGVLADPTTYVGLGTLGIGTAAAQGGKAATKQGVKELLKQGLRTGVVAGIEGGMYAGVDNTMRQSIEISAGRKDEYDAGEIAGSVAVGSLVGLVGGTVVDAGVNRAKQLFARDGVVNHERATPSTNSTSPDQVGETPTPEGVPSPEQLPASSRPEVSTSESNTDMVVSSYSRELAETSPVIPDGYFEYTRLEDLQINQRDTTIPYDRQRMEESISRAFRLADDLKRLDFTQIEDIAEQLRTAKYTKGEFEDIHMSVRMASSGVTSELKAVMHRIQSTQDPQEMGRLVAKQKELLDRYSTLKPLDEAFGSHAGYDLRLRQEGINLKEAPDPVEDPEGFMAFVDRAENDMEVKKKRAEYGQRIDHALAQGDIAEAARLTTLRDLETDEVVKVKVEEGKEGKWLAFQNKLNELFISNVFSPTTVILNVAVPSFKTAVRPLLNAIHSNIADKATRQRLYGTYSGMASSVGGAWRAAVAAFRYEQAILTRESGRLLEGEMAIKGKKGALIRMLPRLLNMSDELLSHMNYQGFIAGDAAVTAYEDGVAKGLKGRELKKHVKEAVQKAVDASYTSPTSKEAVRVVMNKGINLGYKGEELAAYVKREMARDPNALRHGNNEQAIDFVREVLFKDRFSGKNSLSAAAKSYEELVNKVPIIRLIGQLFFRTPVRVFQEGVRLTPGVQVLDPTFIPSLLGKRGRTAQLRAQGEAMMSLALTGMALMLYANGAITGDGAYSNWRQQRNRTDSDLPEPYTIRFPDGSTWSYRNLDPLATPLKIIVNALERYENLETRRMQGEFIGKPEGDQVIAAITVGASAIVQAIRDANLMSGVDALIELGESAYDVEGREGSIIKFVGEKLRMLVPNTLHKIAKSNDPTIDDPVTFFDMVESKILNGVSLGMYDKSVAKSYDMLGNERRIGDTGALWSIFATATPEERSKGLSDVELDVLEKLDYLHKQTPTTFFPPNKHKMLGDADLRTIMTSDGKETLQDRWMRYYRELNPAERLAPILNAGAPIGTREVSGATVTAVQSVINNLRDAAFYRMMSEEAHVTEKVIQNLRRRVEAKAGFWDQPMR